MIEGLHFDITFEEMQAHLRHKSVHHENRRLFYSKSAAALEEGGVKGSNATGGDPVKNLRDKEMAHEEKAEFFAFLADHLIEGEAYRLSEADLRTLEFVSRQRVW